MLGLIAGYDFLATPQEDLVIEVEGRQDVASDNGFLGTHPRLATAARSPSGGGSTGWSRRPGRARTT